MAPFLLIDVGNTRLKWAETTGRGSLRVLGGVPTGALTHRGSTDLARKFPSHRVVISSVVPSVAKKLRAAFGPRAVFMTAKLSGLAFAYPRPAEIGADRLAAALACQGPAIIVSCGTATAFSVLDRDGKFCGGVIAPGLATQLAALLGSTAQLPEVRLRSVSRALARSSREAIQAGVVLNFQGGVREILQRLSRELKTEPRIVVTGGYASYLKGLRVGRMKVRPLLVFEGLHIMGRRVFHAIE